MTEIAYLIDPVAYEAANADMDRRIEASPAPITRALVEQHTASIDEAEKKRIESVRAAAELGLKEMAKHLGAQSLKETAVLLGIDWPDEPTETEV